MRVNVYREEQTSEVKVFPVEPRENAKFWGVRFFLKSSRALHHKEDDDNRSAVTFHFNTLSEAEEFFRNAEREIMKSAKG